jgi:hypothetical protein
MARSGNTWCKKLMHKGKVNALKSKLGNEQGILSRGGATNSALSRALYREAKLSLHHGKMGLPDGDCPDKPQHPVKRVRAFTTETKEGYRPRPFGKRGIPSGCYLAK